MSKASLWFIVDRRFRRTWEDVERRRQAGESLRDVLVSLHTDELVAALAGAGERDPVAANVVATELLNRSARAPFLVASLVSATFVVALLIVDFILTGVPFLVLEQRGSRGFIMIILGGLSAAVSGLMYVAWRGRVPLLTSAVRQLRLRRGY